VMTITVRLVASAPVISVGQYLGQRCGSEVHSPKKASDLLQSITTPSASALAFLLQDRVLASCELIGWPERTNKPVSGRPCIVHPL
jgi:hypothetical protein